MRWAIFILLLLGTLFSLTVFAPAAAGKAGLLWPFAADTQPIVEFVGGPPGQPGSVVTPILAGVAAVFFLTMNIPVPWMYVLTFLVGVGLQYLVPLTIYAADVLLIGRIVGIVLIAGGVLLAFSSLGIFRAAHTTTVPFERPSKLVTWGAYRFTRNPMYLGLALIYVGVAGVQTQIWPVILLLLLAIYIDRVVIPVEEARLREVFGEAYEQYCARVRRWV